MGIGVVLRDIKDVFFGRDGKKVYAQGRGMECGSRSYARSSKFCSSPWDSVSGVGRELHSFSEVCYGHNF